MRLYLLFFMSSLLVFSQALAQKKDAVLAQVGSQKITLEDFNKKYSEVLSSSVNPPTKQQFLEDLVRFELGVQEAEKRNLRNDPLVQERIRQEVYKGLLEKDLSARIQKITVSEAEMKSYYRRNPEIRTSHILVELKPGATKEQKAEALKRANEIYAEVRKSKRPFEELVKLYSDDPLSKQTGGDVGWQSRLTLVPSYYDTIYKMRVGEIRGLIETQFGYHIVKVTGRRDYESANKRQIRAAVFDEKRRDAFNAYFDRLKKSYKIQVNESLIK